MGEGISLLTSAAAASMRSAAMRVVLFRRFVYALQPTPCEQRPKEHRSWNNEYPETPTAACGVRVNSPCADQDKGNGEEQSCGKKNAEEAKHDGGDVHDDESREGRIPYR